MFPAASEKECKIDFIITHTSFSISYMLFMLYLKAFGVQMVKPVLSLLYYISPLKTNTLCVTVCATI